jgi:hypothetical protein
MNFLGILLPPGIARIVTVCFDGVRAGLVQFEASADPRYACVVLDRLVAILRHIFMLCAVFHVPAPQSSEPGRSPRPAREKPNTDDHSASAPPRKREGRVQFPLIPKLARSFRLCDDSGAPILDKAPPAGVIPPRDPIRVLAMRCAQLRHGLDHAARYIEALARAMRRDDFVLLVLPAAPRTTPPTGRRDFWDEQVNIAQEARFVVVGFLRQLNDARRARLCNSS